MSIRPRSRLTTPRLIVTVPIEGAPQARVVAATWQDELRLLLWLEASDVLDGLPDALAAAVEAALGEQDGAA